MANRPQMITADFTQICGDHLRNSEAISVISVQVWNCCAPARKGWRRPRIEFAGNPWSRDGGPMTEIRPFHEDDWSEVWHAIQPVFRAGETYAFSPQITEAEAYQAWVELPSATFVAVDEQNHILGAYYIKPNQPGQGAHVCNCGYIVAEYAWGRGIASALCEHSQREAIGRGFRAMQYNLVVSTNERAVRLWKRHGFHIAGTLPGAFLHPRLGYVDAYVMFKQLAAPA